MSTPSLTPPASQRSYRFLFWDLEVIHARSDHIACAFPIDGTLALLLKAARGGFGPLSRETEFAVASLAASPPFFFAGRAGSSTGAKRAGEDAYLGLPLLQRIHVDVYQARWMTGGCEVSLVKLVGGNYDASKFRKSSQIATE